MPEYDHLDERLAFGFRMLDDSFGTRDADEVPEDWADVEEDGENGAGD